MNSMNLKQGHFCRMFNMVCNLTSSHVLQSLEWQVRMDPSGMYVVCSHSDKCMRVYDFSNGELIAQACGHAEVITGVAFLPDWRRLISVRL